MPSAEKGGAGEWESGDLSGVLALGYRQVQVPTRWALKQAGWLSSRTSVLLLQATYSHFLLPAVPTLSPLDEFLEHVSSEVLANFFNIWLREGVGGG